MKAKIIIEIDDREISISGDHITSVNNSHLSAIMRVLRKKIHILKMQEVRRLEAEMREKKIAEDDLNYLTDTDEKENENV